MDRDRTPVGHTLRGGRRDDVEREVDDLVAPAREVELGRSRLELLGDLGRAGVRVLVEADLHLVDPEAPGPVAPVDEDRVVLGPVVLDRDPEPNALTVLHPHADALLGAAGVVDVLAPPRVGRRVDLAAVAQAAELDPGVGSILLAAGYGRARKGSDQRGAERHQQEQAEHAFHHDLKGIGRNLGWPEGRVRKDPPEP